LNASANPSRINVSHDLAALGIASQNLVPNNRNLDARPLFQAALDYAGQNGIGRVIADRGACCFLTPRAPDRYMSIEQDSLRCVSPRLPATAESVGSPTAAHPAAGPGTAG